MLGPCLEAEMWKKRTPLWREAHLVNIYKTPQVRSTFGSCNVEKVDAVVARSTFGSNVQNTSGPEHFWQLTRSTFASEKCQKLCASEHFWSWDVETVHAVVARSTFGSENVKNTRGSDHFLTIRLPFNVVKVQVVVVRSTFGSEKCQKLMVLSHFWCVRCRFVDR